MLTWEGGGPVSPFGFCPVATVIASSGAFTSGFTNRRTASSSELVGDLELEVARDALERHLLEVPGGKAVEGLRVAEHLA